MRRNVVRNRPKTIAAVLAYAVQHGVNSKRSQRLRLWTKRVSLIRYQIEYVRLFAILSRAGTDRANG